LSIFSHIALGGIFEVQAALFGVGATAPQQATHKARYKISDKGVMLENHGGNFFWGFGQMFPLAQLFAALKSEQAQML
jgi:hypothetical protein